MSNTNNGNNEDCSDGTSYDRWRTLCVDKLKHKLKLNIAKRRKNFEDVVDNATNRILNDNTLEITANPPPFRVSSTITTEAIDVMCATIESWPGVHLSQCKNLPPEFKKYWRIADNWWNRQKGKWFGDLFFRPILQWDLHHHTKKIIPQNDQIKIDYVFYIFLCDILHSKVSFKKARPNPLVFDLALEKSPKLQQWFTTQGQQHSVNWEISTRATQSIKEYAQRWVKAVRERKYNDFVDFMHFKSVNGSRSSNYDPLNVFPPNIHPSSTKIKRDSYSDSRKSPDSSSNNSSDNDQDDEQTVTNNNFKDTSTQPRIVPDTQRSLEEYNALRAELFQTQQQHHVMQQMLNNMQRDLVYKDQWIQQITYMQQMQQMHVLQPDTQTQSVHYPQTTHNIKQEPVYNSNTHENTQYMYSDAYNINQPEFLPQPQRYPMNVAPDPLSTSNVERLLPPPLMTNAGKERRQSYHDVLNMKEWVKRQRHEVKPEESIHSLHTNHSTLTTASHTTVVSNMPPLSMRQSTPNTTTTMVSTPSGSEASAPGRNKFFYNGHRAHNQYHYNTGNPVAALPALQIYGNNYNQPQQQYNYVLPPPNVMPMSSVPKQNNNILPPPNNARRASQMTQQSHQSHQLHGSMSQTPPIHSNHNSMGNDDFADRMFGDNMGNDNSINIDPLEQQMMDWSANNLYKLPGMDQLSAPNLSSTSNNYAYGFSNPNLSSNPNHMDQSIGNCFVNSTSSHHNDMSISNAFVNCSSD